MILNWLQSVVQKLIYFVPLMIVSLTVHEYAHARTAYALGDPTAYEAGRVSLNPLRHLDPVGAVCMVVFGFGWGKAVPISVLNFKNPQRDSALVALAGPTTNLIMACVWGFIFGVISCYDKMPYYFLVLSYYGIFLNCVLCVFNLLPITPLDGSRILSLILPKKIYFKLIKYERILFIILVILMFSKVLSPVIEFLANGLNLGISNTFVKLGSLLGDFILGLVG